MTPNDAKKFRKLVQDERRTDDILEGKTLIYGDAIELRFNPKVRKHCLYVTFGDSCAVYPIDRKLLKKLKARLEIEINYEHRIRNGASAHQASYSSPGTTWRLEAGVDRQGTEHEVKSQ